MNMTMVKSVDVKSCKKSDILITLAYLQSVFLFSAQQFTRVIVMLGYHLVINHIWAYPNYY